MRNFITLLFATLFYLTSFSVETIVQGKISGFDGKTIKIGIYSDYITNEKIWLNKLKIENIHFLVIKKRKW